MSWNQPSVATVDLRDACVGVFLSKVYGWMFVGLLITAGTAFVVASSPTLIETVILNRAVFWILIIAQFGLVFFLSARVNKIAPATAAGLFMLYSAVTGVTSSVILLIYTGASISSTFIITPGMFVATSVFRSVTKRNLPGV